MVTTKAKVENRIKAILADKKRTCRWLSGEMGKAENTISRWCSNKSQPSLQQLFEISIILGVEISDLIKTPDELNNQSV